MKYWLPTKKGDSHDVALYRVRGTALWRFVRCVLALQEACARSSGTRVLIFHQDVPGRQLGLFSEQRESAVLDGAIHLDGYVPHYRFRVGS